MSPSSPDPRLSPSAGSALSERQESLDEHESHRRLRSATISLQAVGGAVVVLGLGILTLALRSLGSPGTLAMAIWYAMAELAVWMVPGIVYLVLAPFVRRRHTWAIWTALTVACLHGPAVGFAIAGASRGGIEMWVPLLMLLATAVGVVSVVVWLIRALRGLKPTEARGFEPLPPRGRAAMGNSGRVTGG